MVKEILDLKTISTKWDEVVDPELIIAGYGTDHDEGCDCPSYGFLEIEM